MDPGQSLLVGQLRWAKKANCTDENDVTQYTLLAYMDVSVITDKELIKTNFRKCVEASSWNDS